MNARSLREVSEIRVVQYPGLSVAGLRCARVGTRSALPAAMTKLIPAWLPVKNRRIEIDPSRLVYRRGYPSSLGPEHDHLQLSVWNAKEVAEAHLEAAIVSDTVDHLVVDVPGEKCHNEKLTAEYGYVTAEHKEHELHHVVYVWRLVRASDGKILYDSLDDASESWRTVGSSNAPLDWGEIVRRLRNAGELTQVPYRSFWSWP